MFYKIRENLVYLKNPRPIFVPYGTNIGRGNVLAGLCPKGMCAKKNSWCEAKIRVKATSSAGESDFSEFFTKKVKTGYSEIQNFKISGNTNNESGIRRQ